VNGSQQHGKCHLFLNQRRQRLLGVHGLATQAGASSHVSIRTLQHIRLRQGYGGTGGPPTSSAACPAKASLRRRVQVNLGNTIEVFFAVKLPANPARGATASGRVMSEGGKLADVARQVTVTPAAK